jgi:hypothetical protein
MYTTAAAQQGGQMPRPYRTPPSVRMAQQVAPEGPQQNIIYDGYGNGAPAPTPIDDLGGYSNGESYTNDGYYNSGSYYGDGSYGGDCGCNGGGGGCDGSCGGYGGSHSGCGECSGGCCGSCGDQSCAGGAMGCALACCQPRCSFYADWLYLQVVDADVAHAQQQNGIGGAGTVPFGDVGTVEMEYNSGGRVGGSIACGPCSGVNVSFTHFESDSFNVVEPPFIPGGGGAVGSLVHHPGAAITASVGPVAAEYAIDYQLGEIMYRSLLSGGACHTINYAVGAQLGHLEQGFVQTGIFSGGQSGTIDTYTNIDFDGGGLKAGLDAERWLGWGFSAYGRAAAAIMTGRFSSHYRMINSTTDVRLAIVDWKDDRVVPHLEYEVGLSWTSPSGHWRFATGYLLSHWANVVSTPEFIDAVQANNYVDVDGDLTFDGAVTRAEVRW